MEVRRRKKEEGRRKKEEGRRKKWEERRRKQKEGRRNYEEGGRTKKEAKRMKKEDGRRKKEIEKKGVGRKVKLVVICPCFTIFSSKICLSSWLFSLIYFYPENQFVTPPGLK
jgi:hypothetical protein